MIWDFTHPTSLHLHQHNQSVRVSNLRVVGHAIMVPSLPIPCAVKPCEGNWMTRKDPLDLTNALLLKPVSWQRNPMWWTSQSRTLPCIWLVRWFPTINRIRPFWIGSCSDWLDTDYNNIPPLHDISTMMNETHQKVGTHCQGPDGHRCTNSLFHLVSCYL